MPSYRPTTPASTGSVHTSGLAVRGLRGTRFAERRWGAGITALVLLTLTACHGSPPPVTSDDLPPLPGAWSTPVDDSRSDSVPADDTAQPDHPHSTASPWRQRLDSAQLDAFVGEALEKNFDLRAAAATVDVARAQARGRGAELKPQVSFNLDGSRRQQVFVGLPVPGSDGVLKSQSTSFTGNFAIAWEADLWGRLKAGKRAAGEDLQAAEADYAAARLSLAAQVTKAWIQLLEAERRVALGEATVDSRSRTRERVEARFRRGVAPSVDVRLARTNEAAAEGDLASRRRALDGVRRQLEVLLGRPPSGNLEAQGTLPSLPPPLAPGLPAELLRRRPDLRAGEARLRAAGWRVTEARTAFYPRLTLTGSGGSSSDSLSDLLDGDFSIWSLAGGLLQPIFQGGRLRAAAELAEASRERSLAAYAQVLLRALAEVETTLAAETWLQGEEDAFRRAQDEARQAARLAEDRYKNGVGDYLAVLESQRLAFDAETRLLAIRGQRLRNRVDLHLALGDGAHSAPGVPGAPGVPEPPESTLEPQPSDRSKSEELR